MKRTSWMLGAAMTLILAACGGPRDAGTGGAGTETGSPGMSSDTAAPPAGAGAMDTAMTDTSAMTDTAADTASH